jgi:hypothetical protein
MRRVPPFGFIISETMRLDNPALDGGNERADIIQRHLFSRKGRFLKCKNQHKYLACKA